MRTPAIGSPGTCARRRRETTFEDAMRRAVLRPAGLSRPPSASPARGHRPRRPESRTRGPAGRPAASCPMSPTCCGSARGTWRSPAAARMRVAQGKPTAGVYGLGLFGERVGGVEVWGHGGSYGGFQSLLLLVPDRQAVFAGLTNGSLGAKALYDLEAEFFEDVVGELRRAPMPVDLPQAVLDSYAGSYANNDDRYEVRAVPGGLVVTLEGDEYPARAIGERTFEVTRGRRDPRALRFPARGLRPIRQPARRAARVIRPAVAAGHPATASAGAAVLAAGGNAADAVVAASLVSCVAETLMTGCSAAASRSTSTRRAARCATSTASSRCRPDPAQRWNRCPSSSATRSSTTRSARRRVRCPGSRRASTRSGARMDACRGRELVEPALQAGARPAS